jgi:putative endonuclease
MYVYTLRLENDCWYGGATNDVDRRFQEHLDGRGTSWTQMHTPIAVSAQKQCTDDTVAFEEDLQTKKPMAEYGIDRVRGASYASINLSGSQRDCLKKEIHDARWACFSCGEAGHMSSRPSL